MTWKVLDEHRAGVLERFCELIVPGSSCVGPVVYLDAVLADVPESARAGAFAAIDAVAHAESADDLAELQYTPEFAMLRALAIEAYYSDFVAPGSPGPSAWSTIDFQVPRAIDLERDWSFLEIS